MPRSRKSQMDAHIEERDGEEQAEMFPELDDTVPEQKELMRLAKRVAKLKAERENLLSTSKEKVDSAVEKLIAQMHTCKIDKFKHKGVKAERFDGKEKVEVEVDEDTPDDE